MMRSMRNALCLGIVVTLSGAAMAADAPTVQSLLSQEFTVVGTIFNPQAGAGVFLQKKDRLFMCLVSETPQSAAVTTRYCKPVQ